MIYRYILLSFLILFSSCRKKETYPHVSLYGHAGMGLNIPNAIYAPNTKEAIDFACSFDKNQGVELDVRLSKDGKLWCYHDDRLESTTNGIGCIENSFSDDLSEINYQTVNKENLFRLESHALNKEKKYLFDLKLYNTCEQKFVDVEAFKQQLFLLSSEISFAVIVSSKAYLSFFENDFQCYYSGPIYEIDNDLINDSILTGFVVRNKEASFNWIQQMKLHGKEVMLYDIRSNSGNRIAFEKNPEAILTDDLRSAIGYLP